MKAKSSKNKKILSVRCPECFCTFTGFKPKSGTYKMQCEMCGKIFNIKIKVIYKIISFDEVDRNAKETE